MAPSRFWRLAAVAATALLLATATDAAKKKSKAEEVTHKARNSLCVPALSRLTTLHRPGLLRH